MSIASVYEEAYNAALSEEPMTAIARQQLTKDYNRRMKALPESERDEVSNILAKVIQHYQQETKAPKTRVVTLKKKTVPGSNGSKTYFYDLEDLPDVLATTLLLVLRHIFPL